MIKRMTYLLGFLIFLTALLLPTPAFANDDTPETDAMEATLREMFPEGMRNTGVDNYEGHHKIDVEIDEYGQTLIYYKVRFTNCRYLLTDWNFLHDRRYEMKITLKELKASGLEYDFIMFYFQTLECNDDYKIIRWEDGRMILQDALKVWYDKASVDIAPLNNSDDFGSDPEDIHLSYEVHPALLDDVNGTSLYHNRYSN